MIQRLDKIISSQLNISRNDARSLIKGGNVICGGNIQTDPSAKLDTDVAEISVNGKPLFYKEHIYIMMNKPQGVVSATEDKNIKTVIDILPDNLKRKNLFPAGRLDRDTVGFMLITDDGDFAHRILSPSKHVEKTYIAHLAESLSEENRKVLESGAVLSDGTQCMEAIVKILDSHRRVAEVKLREGKYHQIKRMFASVDNKVVFLKRTHIGNLKLDDTLEEGQAREITQKELRLIAGDTIYCDNAQ